MSNPIVVQQESAGEGLRVVLVDVAGEPVAELVVEQGFKVTFAGNGMTVSPLRGFTT